MYDVFYGLSGRPFQLTPDPAYYFESQTHRKALSYLGYGLAQGEGFIVITGEVGAGKTTLVGHLMQTIDRARLTAAQIVTTQVGDADLLHLAAQGFGIDTKGLDKAATLHAIEQFLHAEARAGRRCLLVVDESQNLPVRALEELRMLSNFQLGNQALLQIFLLGQPEFRDVLKKEPALEQLRQRVIATHHLEAMEADEIQPYVEHRLGKVGWHGQPALKDEIYPLLYRASGGIPRKLNALVSRVLLMGAVEQADVIDMAMAEHALHDLNGDLEQEAEDAAAATQPGAEPETVTAPADPAAVHYPDNVLEDVPADKAVEGCEDDVHVVEDPEVADHGDDHSSRIARLEQALEDAAGSAVSDADTSQTELNMALNRICAMEERVAEQERAIRRTLTMLIHWVEDGEFPAGNKESRAA